MMCINAKAKPTNNTNNQYKIMLHQVWQLVVLLVYTNLLYETLVSMHMHIATLYLKVAQKHAYEQMLM